MAQRKTARLQGAHVSEERTLSAVGIIKKDTQDHTFLSCLRTYAVSVAKMEV